MKYVDKLIQDYKFAMYNDSEFTFTESKCFNWDSFYEELFDISEVQDKIIFLKFIEYKMYEEFNSLQYNIEHSKEYLKKHSTKDDKYALSLDNDLEYIEEKYNALKSFLKTIGKEISDLMVLLKDDSAKVTKISKPESISTLTDFKTYTLKKDNTRKIQWLEDETLIVYLFEMLYANGCISKSDYDYFPEFLVNNFVNKKGEPFKMKNLNSTKSNLVDNVKNGEPRNAHKIKRIFIK